jgi:3-phosphoshikimate 1-carboxyvinyltransferase
VTINHPKSTQFVSALLLIGVNIQTDSTSPYITLTHKLIQHYTTLHHSTRHYTIEKDWSSAAFWYEYVALHGGEITLPGLYRDSLQGDKVVADIFAHLGVHTEYTAEGITLSPHRLIASSPFASRLSPFASSPLASNILVQDFGSCPDLYPAVALTCERLGIELHATGVESLPLKESDRLRAVREHRTDADHRMAMALLVAGYPIDDTDCIRKSYPQFLQQYPPT